MGFFFYKKNDAATLRVPGAAGPGHNANEHPLASWDKALQSEFARGQFASTG